MKSDNYGIKETALIQSGRRGGDMEWADPHTRVMCKNLGGITQEKGVPAPHEVPQPRVPVPGR